MSSIELQAIDQSIKQARKAIDLGDALERLKGNRDFKRIIQDGYFEQEAVRLVHLKSSPTMQSAESQKSIDQQMVSIGSLDQYFRTIAVQAEMARKSIKYDEQVRDELIEEGAN